MVWEPGNILSNHFKNTTAQSVIYLRLYIIYVMSCVLCDIYYIYRFKTLLELKTQNPWIGENNLT